MENTNARRSRQSVWVSFTCLVCGGISHYAFDEHHLAHHFVPYCSYCPGHIICCRGIDIVMSEWFQNELDAFNKRLKELTRQK